MSCKIFLYDQINIGCPDDPLCGEVVPTGGFWTLYSSPVGYPVSFLVDGAWQLITNDMTVFNGGYNPEVELADLPYGDYILAYNYGEGCKQQAFLQLFGLPKPCSADPINVSVCSGIGEVSLYDLAKLAFSEDCVPTENGTWSVQDATGLTWNQSNDGDGTNDTIDIDNTSNDVEYVFTYTYYPDNIEHGSTCDDCYTIIEMTLTVTESPSASTGENVVVC